MAPKNQTITTTVASPDPDVAAKPAVVAITVRFPEHVYKAVKHYAVDHSVKARDVITEAVKQYLGLAA